MSQPQESPLSQPGPHGFPMRFAVRSAGPGGLKVCGDDYKQPVRFMRKRGSRSSQCIVLHEGAHKRDKSAPLVTVEKKQALKGRVTVQAGPVWLQSRPRGNRDFDLTLHTRGNATTLKLVHQGRRRRYRFALPGAGPAHGPSTEPEQFEWRRAPSHCYEVRGIRKKAKPTIRTGDPRPASKKNKIHTLAVGFVLVRLGARRGPAGDHRPLGYTEDGEEIVASYALAHRSWRANFFFQFWGSAAEGRLGEVFTNVAVATASAIWQDEKIEQERKRRRMSSV